MTVALIGNPNSGKTTVFNNLTGARQHVGNWPGVTVQRKEGVCNYDGRTLKVVDLPGVYSLTAYAPDEMIARDFVVEEVPDVVVDVVDASNLERNLYLVTQLLEMGANLVLVLNMMDVAEARDYRIDVDALSSHLGVPVVPMTAHRSRETGPLLRAVVEAADGQRRLGGFRLRYVREVEEEIGRLEEVVSKTELASRYPANWLTIKLLEEDEQVEGKCRAEAVLKARDEGLDRLRRAYGDDAETLIADARYGYVGGLVKDVTRAPAVTRLTLTDTIDSFLLNRWVGLPILLALFYGLFQFAFVLSPPLMDWIDGGVVWLGDRASGISPDWLGSLLSDGVIAGVGSVLVFVPPIFLLFLALSILEDSGYMARAAFVMDRVMHGIGLHGRSFVPMMLGLGCSVPAVMATRTIENPKDRLVTILVTPFISCGARLPIYVLFAGVFFAAYQGLVVFSMYLIGVLMAFLAALVLRRFVVSGPSGHFVMELPPYRMPTVRGTVIHTWERGREFLSRAGTVIFVAVVVIWLLDYVGALEPIGRAIAPLFAPAGFGQWQNGVALVFGLLAKEAVVGTYGTLFAGAESTGGLGQVVGTQLGWTALTAYSFMLFTLIYVPCAATLGVIRQEAGSWKWAAFAAAFSIGLAWVVAVVVFQVGSLFDR